MTKLALCLLLACGLAGCGEYKGLVPYENGAFQGKHDQRVWDSARFGHQKEVWVEVIHARNLQQNEYRRTDYQEP
ncbi:MAG TPA: hypothetical protein VGK14_12595 [Novimethylophilus sp.]|jgi:hypothetical protein|uniref:hypothetical protein n=1 Tax=Novimethylophilus sp. TaxID=2137426 RepID=UPI002F417E47